mmetsp:Transcript_35041/g.117129  ORF Transcript_35041/g.117129 Transcript_35041/m.117129 type:complete len:424 (+) Transcript_35041:1141-2412(+)
MSVTERAHWSAAKPRSEGTPSRSHLSATRALRHRNSSCPVASTACAMAWRGRGCGLARPLARCGRGSASRRCSDTCCNWCRCAICDRSRFCCASSCCASCACCQRSCCWSCCCACCCCCTTPPLNDAPPCCRCCCRACCCCCITPPLDAAPPCCRCCCRSCCTCRTHASSWCWSCCGDGKDNCGDGSCGGGGSCCGGSGTSGCDGVCTSGGGIPLRPPESCRAFRCKAAAPCSARATCCTPSTHHSSRCEGCLSCAGTLSRKWCVRSCAKSAGGSQPEVKHSVYASTARSEKPGSVITTSQLRAAPSWSVPSGRVGAASVIWRRMCMRKLGTFSPLAPSLAAGSWLISRSRTLFKALPCSARALCSADGSYTPTRNAAALATNLLGARIRRSTAFQISSSKVLAAGTAFSHSSTSSLASQRLW